MNRFRSARRRVLTVAASVFVGLVGAAALAGPAHAQPTDEPTAPPTEAPGVPEVTDDFNCREGHIIVTNPANGVPVTVTVTTSRDEPQTAEIAPGEQFIATFRGNRGLRYQVTVDGELLAEGGWDICDEGGGGPSPVVTSSRSDCDSITVVAENIVDVPVKITFISGDVTEMRTLAEGETVEVTFDAEEGTIVTVTGDFSSDEVVAWVEPEGCDGEGGGLPVTGASTGIVAGVAVALLAIGTGLFLVARRRRITFTA